MIFLYGYFTWLALQNLLLPLAYQQGWLSAGSVGLLMTLKEAVLVLALLALCHRAFRKGWRFNVADQFALAYAVLLVLYLVFAPLLLGSSVSFFIRAVSLRYLIALALFYFWGRLSLFELGELKSFVRFMVILQVLVAVFGIVEWVLLPLSFWQDTVGAGLFMADIKGLPEGVNVLDGLPGNMLRSGIRRSIATYGDPLSMGIACLFPLLLCAAWLYQRASDQEEKKRWLWWLGFLILAVALFMTNGRESIGVAVFSLMLLALWAGKLPNILLVTALVLCVAWASPAAWQQITDTVTFRESSASTHLEFIHSGWQTAPKLIFGKGLGEAGGWAYSLAGVESEVGENAYFELMAQTGLLSVCLLMAFLITMYKRARWFAERMPDKLLSAAFAAMAANIAARSIMAIFSPSLFAVIPMAGFFFLCGAACTSMDHLGLLPGMVLKRAFIFRSGHGIKPSPAGRLLRATRI